MTTDAINESGMTFGPYPSGHCFYIEKSTCYKKVMEGVKMAEFLLLMQHDSGQMLWVVEAKNSSPKPKTQPNFNEFIDDIRAKLTNGFLLATAALLLRHPDANDELPDTFKALSLNTLQFRFVLVINGCQQDWLAPLQDALAVALKPVVKTWALPATSIAVLNHDMAQTHGLIL
jgi:hypothetical protein